MDAADNTISVADAADRPPPLTPGPDSSVGVNEVRRLTRVIDDPLV
jgi:hypothetical protein